MNVLKNITNTKIEDKKPLLEMVNIRKTFGKVIALQNEDFRIYPGEIVGLVGDNGAGKSTLIKIITGVVRQDRGEIYWKGKNISKHSVEQSRMLGIETVYQDRALGEKQKIWRNIFMGREITFSKTGFIQLRKSEQRTKELINEMGFTRDLDTDMSISGLSGGEKQGVAIARALYFDADLIILDEPTNNLSITETDKVLNFIKGIKDKGKSCIFITHNIYHVYPVADRIVIVDRGKVVGDFQKKNISMDYLIKELQSIAAKGEID